jgi:peroxiredoxin
MLENLFWIIPVAAVLLAAAGWFAFRSKAGPALPDSLRIGHALPEFAAIDEDGNTVSSQQLLGSPTALFFVRGNWCPFCTRQAEELVGYYRQMTDLGAKIVFVTPKPVETTRRVAEFFKLEFDYWFDENLQASKQLGLLLPGGVPDSYRAEYDKDTMWPATFIIDGEGIIRFAKLSRLIVDRPNPKELLRLLERL